MKILHCCLACFYIDNYSYQENMLPRYHKLMGHDVQIVASTESFNEDGELTYINSGEYYNEDGIKVYRLDYSGRMPEFVKRKIRRYKGFNNVLDSFKPDFVFVHDIQFLDIDILVKYAQNNNVRIVCDCHADFSNSARNFISRYILHGIVYKRCAKKIEPYTERFFGVLPARVDFLKNVYNLPESKCDLLLMGVDDYTCNKIISEEKKKQLKLKYGITPSDFLIVTGGKIDLFKTQTLLLMEAVKKINNPNLKLIVFGSVVPELKEKFDSMCDNNIIYAGWQNNEGSISLFSAADLVIFPGRHSVFWEQVAGIGKPMICKYWDGTTHVNVNGNVIFVETDSVNELQEKIEKLFFTPDYYRMKKNAELAKTRFMYSDIAKKCLMEEKNYDD